MPLNLLIQTSFLGVKIVIEIWEEDSICFGLDFPKRNQGDSSILGYKCYCMDCSGVNMHYHVVNMFIGYCEALDHLALLASMSCPYTNHNASLDLVDL